MKGTVQTLKLKEIKRDQNPRVINKTQEKTTNLFLSIKKNGVQNPVHVRKNGKGYVLIAGERRLTIAEMLKLDSIPAVILDDMTDEAAYDLTHFENVGRRDLTPIEMARNAEKMMQLFKGDKKAIASKLGIDAKQVSLRVNLMKLSDKWQAALDREEEETWEDGTVHDLTISHLELIARLPEEQQDEILGEEENAADIMQWDGPMPVSKLKSYIATQYAHALDDKLFNLDGEFEGLPVCNECPARSDVKAQTELWDVEYHDKAKKRKVVRCLNPECYKQKLAIVRKEAIEEAKAKNKDIQVLATDYKVLEDLKKGEISAASATPYTPARKSDKGAIPVIKVGPTSVSKVSYVMPPRKNGAPQSAPSSSGKATVKTMAERRKQLKGLRTGIVLDALKEAILESNGPIEKLNTIEYLASLVVVFGGDSYARTVNEDFPTVKVLSDGESVDAHLHQYKQDKKGKHGLLRLLWEKIKGNLVSGIGYCNAMSALDCEKHAKDIATLIAFDWNKAFKQAEKDKPEPKGWKNLKADGTPK